MGAPSRLESGGPEKVWGFESLILRFTIFSWRFDMSTKPNVKKASYNQRPQQRKISRDEYEYDNFYAEDHPDEPIKLRDDDRTKPDRPTSLI